MILINLLPQELRVTEHKKVDLPYKWVLITIFLIVLAVSIYNLLIFLRLRENHRELKSKWMPLAQSSMQADALERELSISIMAELGFYDSLVKPPLETAQVMNLVSDLLPEGLWLVQFQFVRDKKEMQLILNGLSESTGKDSKLIEIQNFANALKDRLELILSPDKEKDTVKSTSPVLEGPPGGLPGFQPAQFLVPKKNKIEVTVTTSSEKSVEGRGQLIQFVTTFKTEGFGAKNG